MDNHPRVTSDPARGNVNEREEEDGDRGDDIHDNPLTAPYRDTISPVNRHPRRQYASRARSSTAHFPARWLPIMSGETLARPSAGSDVSALLRGERVRPQGQERLPVDGEVQQVDARDGGERHGVV